MINQFPICTPLRCYVSDEYMYIERNDTCLTLFSDFDILNSIYLTSMEGRFRIFYGVFFIYFFYLKIIFSDTRKVFVGIKILNS